MGDPVPFSNDFALGTGENGDGYRDAKESLWVHTFMLVKIFPFLVPWLRTASRLVFSQVTQLYLTSERSEPVRHREGYSERLTLCFLLFEQGSLAEQSGTSLQARMEEVGGLEH